MNKLSAFIVTSALVVAGYVAYDHSAEWLGWQDEPAVVAVLPEATPASAPEAEMAPTAEAAPQTQPEPAPMRAALDEKAASKKAVSSAPRNNEPSAVQAPVTAVANTSPAAEPGVEKTKEPALRIKDIKFTGVTLFPEKTLAATVAEFIGKELSVEEAFAIPAKIANHYKSQNQMAIATLVGGISPSGVLTVGVVEMPMTQTQADKALSSMAAPSPTPAPVTAPSVSAAVTVPTPTTAPTSAPSAASAAVSAITSVSSTSSNAASSLPTPAQPVTVSPAVVTPKAAPPASAVVVPNQIKDSAKAAAPEMDAETEYILKQYAKKSRQYEIMVDNYGPASTGAARLGASMAWGEQLSLLGFKSQGSEYLRMAYRWVTGVEGLSIGVHASQLNYEVVNNLQNALYKSGDAVKRGVELVYELVNESSQISSLALKFDNKSSSAIGLNLANSASYVSWVSGLELKGLLREMIPGGAVFTYNAQYALGNVDTTGASTIGGIDVDEGTFSKIRFNGTIMQPLGGLGSLFAGLTVQRSNRNLDPSERFYLGGPLGVRAYGMGEGAGSEGEIATLEFRQRLGTHTTLSEFYDWGRVRLTQEATSSSSLSGVGVSLSHDMSNGVTLKGTWARSTGNTPPLPLNPNGGDNVDRNRFWLSMETRF